MKSSGDTVKLPLLPVKKAHCNGQATVGDKIGKVARLNACAFLNETDLPQTIPFT